jgi:hypothetical protein
MVDTKPLLKGFGAAADVIGQIATDKAVNSRRTRSNFTQFDITNGQLVEDATTTDPEKLVYHGLKRAPRGVIVLKSDQAVVVVGTTDLSVELDVAGALVTLWIV